MEYTAPEDEERYQALCILCGRGCKMQQFLFMWKDGPLKTSLKWQILESLHHFSTLWSMGLTNVSSILATSCLHLSAQHNIIYVMCQWIVIFFELCRWSRCLLTILWQRTELTYPWGETIHKYYYLSHMHVNLFWWWLEWKIIHSTNHWPYTISWCLINLL